MSAAYRERDDAMISRREFIQAGAAAAAIFGASGFGDWARLAAQQRLSEDDLLGVEPFGNVTLVHLTDIHGQLMPVHFREPSVNIGVGENAGLPPHVTGAEFLKLFDIEPGSPWAHALSSEDFVALAKAYGKMGGADRIAAVLKRIRAERPEATLFLDGGDTWQGSYTSLMTKGADMVEVMNAMTPDAMTGHWEFTYGDEHVKELVEALAYPFLAANIFDNEWDEPVFEAVKTIERGGAKIAVIGQAFPYTPIANPRWMFPNWSFGIREEEIARHVEEARSGGADAVILLSHNGFDVDRKLASRVNGIDVILTGHTHDALPAPVMVGSTALIASGSNGKFVSRIDLDTGEGKVRDIRHRLIPIFSDVITPDPDMTALVKKVREPYAAELARELGRTDSLLYRRGNLNGTWDDLICDALIEVREADIALSPGFRWGTSLMPGQAITVEDLHNACAMTYPEAYRSTMSGKLIKDILEDVADNLFNVDPYYQQGGDMVRVGGLGYTIDIGAEIGSRINDMTLLKSGEAIDPARDYIVAGWASINENVEGPPIWEVVETYLAAKGTVSVKPNRSVVIQS